MEFEEKKYKISFLGGPTTPTYSICFSSTLSLIVATSKQPHQNILLPYSLLATPAETIDQ